MTSNECTVKDSFAFAEEIVEQDFEFFMESLDVDSLFTNTQLEETIDICTNTFFENTEKEEGLSKIEFKKLLSLLAKESYFIFNRKLYNQVDGVTRGSTLGPLANRKTLAKVWLTLFLCTLKRSGYKIVYLTLILITTNGMLMISLFLSPYQSIRSLPKLFLSPYQSI